MEAEKLKLCNDLDIQIRELQEHIKDCEQQDLKAYNVQYYTNVGKRGSVYLKKEYINSDEILLVYLAKIKKHLQKLKDQFEKL